MLNQSEYVKKTGILTAVFLLHFSILQTASPQEVPAGPVLSVPASVAPAGEMAEHEKNAGLFLDRCRQRLRHTMSINAKIEYAAVFFGEKATGNGIYLEQKSETGVPSFYFQLTHNRSDYHITQNLLLDGQNQKFWQNQMVKWSDAAQKTENPRNKRLETLSSEYSCVNIAKVHELYRQDPQNHLAIAPPWYGTSSLENIIYEIQRNFRFYSSAETVLKRLPQEIQVYRAEGEWRKEAIQKIFAARKIAPGAMQTPVNFAGMTPEELPSTVAVYVDKTNYFPYQIEFYRPDETGKQKMLLQISFYEVLLSVRFRPGEFLFQLPTGASEVDRTGEFLHSRGRVATETAATQAEKAPAESK